MVPKTSLSVQWHLRGGSNRRSSGFGVPPATFAGQGVAPAGHHTKGELMRTKGTSVVALAIAVFVGWLAPYAVSAAVNDPLIIRVYRLARDFWMY